MDLKRKILFLFAYLLLFNSVCFALIKDKTYFQSTYNLDDEQIRILLIETDNLKKYTDLAEDALKDGSYLKYRKLIHYYHSDYDLKDNYSTYILLEQNGELSEEQIANILRELPVSCMCLNIFKYRGNKEYKVQKILKNKKLTPDDKYKKAMKLVKYKKAPIKEIKSDFGERIGSIIAFICSLGYLSLPSADEHTVRYYIWR